MLPLAIGFGLVSAKFKRILPLAEPICKLICSWVVGIQSDLALAGANRIDFPSGWREVSRNYDFVHLVHWFGLVLGLI